MQKRSRGVPKELAFFGEKQFHDTGAAAVEILRVKASTIRKHFKSLKGTAFLVAVVNLDRVRIYMFNQAGVMLGAENLEEPQYFRIRKTSRLLSKFEKPIPPTEEELRMEATEDLRSALSRAIRKVSRSLAQSEPDFPTIFVTKEIVGSGLQSFGLRIDDDGAIFFAEESLKEEWSPGIVLRAAFLALLRNDNANLAFSSSIGNALAFSLLKGTTKKQWLKVWRENTKGTPFLPLVNHLVKHSGTYSDRGFSWVLSLLQKLNEPIDGESLIEALKLIHGNLEVALGTEHYHVIQGFCKTLVKPRKLAARRHILDAIHLAPRVLCNPIPLGIQLTVETSETSQKDDSTWLEVECIAGQKKQFLTIRPSSAFSLESIHYMLNIEDFLPKPTGIAMHGKDVLRWALRSLGVSSKREATFEANLVLKDTEIKSGERAVLGRLAEGQLDVLSNTLIGSPQRLEALTKKDCIVLVPDFNHLGLKHDFLIVGDTKAVKTTISAHALEATIFEVSERSYAIVSAPHIWGKELLIVAAAAGLGVYPIAHIDSSRGFLRREDVFPSNPEGLMWSDGRSS